MQLGNMAPDIEGGGSRRRCTAHKQPVPQSPGRQLLKDAKALFVFLQKMLNVEAITSRDPEPLLTCL
jgi:hypothetical protein